MQMNEADREVHGFGSNSRLANAKSSMVLEINADAAFMDEMERTESISSVQANPWRITPANCTISVSSFVLRTQRAEYMLDDVRARGQISISSFVLRTQRAV